MTEFQVGLVATIDECEDKYKKTKYTLFTARPSLSVYQPFWFHGHLSSPATLALSKCANHPPSALKTGNIEAISNVSCAIYAADVSVFKSVCIPNWNFQFSCSSYGFR